MLHDSSCQQQIVQAELDHVVVVLLLHTAEW